MTAATRYLYRHLPVFSIQLYHLFIRVGRNGACNQLPVTAMSIVSLITQLRTSARRFIRADEGNIAVIFAITVLPILGLVGAAIDYSRVSGARASMQSALDSTALMLS